MLGLAEEGVGYSLDGTTANSSRPRWAAPPASQGRYHQRQDQVTEYKAQ